MRTSEPMCNWNCSKRGTVRSSLRLSKQSNSSLTIRRFSNLWTLRGLSVKDNHTRADIFMAVNIKITVFLDDTQSGLCFAVTCNLQFHCRNHFEFFTAVVMKSSIFWDIKPCRTLKVNRCFGGSCRTMAYSSTTKMEAISSPETSVHFQWTTRRYIPEDRTVRCRKVCH
jgi:hypothetical protein